METQLWEFQKVEEDHKRVKQKRKKKELKTFARSKKKLVLRMSKKRFHQQEDIWRN